MCTVKQQKTRLIYTLGGRYCLGFKLQILGPCHSLVSLPVLALFHYEFSVFRFITGPAELGDVPIPRTPPKMFVNTDSEQEELVLVVYKVRVIHFDVQYYATCISLISHCRKKKKKKKKEGEKFSPQTNW